MEKQDKYHSLKNAARQKPSHSAARRWLFAPIALAAIAMFGLALLLARPGQGQDGARNGKSLPGIYTRYQGHIYMNIPGEGYYLVPGADAGSFGPLGGWDSARLGKDKNAVYCGSQAVVQLRPEQVRFVRNSYVSDGKRAWYCTKEKNNAAYRWWQDVIRSGDKDSPDKPRAKDYVLVQLKPVNAAKLKTVIGAYAQDGEHAFYDGMLIPGADGLSLQGVKLGWGRLAGRIDEHYARDSSRVYYLGIPLPGAHPATFAALEPEGDQWNNLYGLDTATGRFYFGARPFPAQVDGVDSSALHLLIADRQRANHELFYNASGIWYWDYQAGALKRGCDNPFKAADLPHAAPVELSPGVWADEHNTFMLRAVDEWQNSRSDHSLEARKTQLRMLPGLASSQWHKLADLTGGGGMMRGTLWKAGSLLFFAPKAGQSHFFNDALYIVLDLDGLKRDLMSDQYYFKAFKAQDLQRLDASDSTAVCRMTSRYPAIWEFWK